MISVIIPAFNAEATIGRALHAVVSQSSVEPFEVIVVDDGSTDATANAVGGFPQVRYIVQPNSGPASARNRGAAEASGEVLLFTDADCVPEDGWLPKMTAGFKDPSVGAVAGSYGIANQEDRLARIIHAEIRFRHLKLMPEYPRAFGSYNVAIRSALFRRLGGFSVSYRHASGEDNDLSYRVLHSGSRIFFRRDACVAHYHQHDLGKYLREQFRHGFWRVRLYLDHSSMAAGDDYTFWKDIVEVPLVFAQALFLWWWPGLLALMGGFLLFETGAGLLIIGFSLDGVYGGLVMWLRAFARTAGLLSGGIHFLKNNSTKEKKS